MEHAYYTTSITLSEHHMIATCFVSHHQCQETWTTKTNNIAVSVEADAQHRAKHACVLIRKVTCCDKLQTALIRNIQEPLC